MWVERAHLRLIESICSLFSMVLFFCFFTLTHALESTAQPCFFPPDAAFSSATIKAAFSPSLELTGLEAVPYAQVKYSYLTLPGYR